MPTESRCPPTLVQPIPLYAAGGFDCGPATPTAAMLRDIAARAPAKAAERGGVPDTDRGRHTDSTAEVVAVQSAAKPAAGRPAAGTRFGEFLLLEEIGRGAFSRVFLAQQPDLADRTVVVKVTVSAARESHALARLQHPNIVPIHSTHRAGDRHLVCMPYLGTVTLADVYRTLDSMPSLPDSGRDLFSTLRTRRAPTRHADPTPAGPRPPEAVPALASLAGRSYIDAVLWMAARLADGLAHAHDRGVTHRDLKPANVLLADDGQPMLLDFNLASSATAGGDDARGGTPQYMSPEQLQTFAGRPHPVDGRTDLYSLGVLVFELLTRQSPFPRHKPVNADALTAMIADRAGPPPRLRGWNRAVSPAVESIVRRCLEPDPAARYQSAHELKADLERHLAHRPLCHAAEPSARERARKWGRRNHRLTVLSGVLAAAVVLAAVVTGGYSRRGTRLTHLEAAVTAREFAADAQHAVVLLADGGDRARADEGVRACEAALARYAVVGRPDWSDRDAVEGLDPADQERLRDRVGELLVLLGRATARRAVLDAGRADPTPALRQAFDLNTAAVACYAGRPEPRGVWEHRAELARLLGRPDEARQLAQRAVELPPDSAADRLLLAHRHLTHGQYKSALPLLRELSRNDRQNFAVWYMLGVCHLELAQDAAAVVCLTSSIALRPDCHWAWFERGRVMRRLGDADQCQADFERVVALRPDFPRGKLTPAAGR